MRRPGSAGTPKGRAGGRTLSGTRHIGIVESVTLDGSVSTIEGNSSHQVARRHHAVAAATGYVRL